MRPINQKIKDKMSNDPFYKECLIINDGCCEGRIEWHHNLIFAGQQLDEKWAILPLCEFHHRNINTKMIKEQCDHVMLNRATDQELEAVSKAVDYKRERDRLNKIYD